MAPNWKFVEVVVFYWATNALKFSRYYLEETEIFSQLSRMNIGSCCILLIIPSGISWNSYICQMYGNI